MFLQLQYTCIASILKCPFQQNLWNVCEVLRLKNSNIVLGRQGGVDGPQAVGRHIDPWTQTITSDQHGPESLLPVGWKVLQPD